MERNNLADILEASLKKENLIEPSPPDPPMAPRSPPKKNIFKFSEPDSVIHPKPTGTPKFSESQPKEKARKRSNAGFFRPAEAKNETEKDPDILIEDEFEIDGMGEIWEYAGHSANVNENEDSQSDSDEFDPNAVVVVKKREVGEEKKQGKIEVKEIEKKSQKKKIDLKTRGLMAEAKIQQAEMKAPAKAAEANKEEKEDAVETENEWNNVAVKQIEEIKQDKREEFGFFNRNLTVDDVLQFIESIQVDIPPSPKHSFFKSLFSCFRVKSKSRSVLSAQKQRIQKFSLTLFNESENLHVSIFKKIFTALKNSENCSMAGDHWKDLGFQGKKPETDLRQAGMFGAFCIFYFLEKHPSYSRRIYMLSLDPVNRFPFASVCILFSLVALDSLEKNILLREIENNDRVYEVVLDFFCGLVVYWAKTFKDNAALDIMKSKEETAIYASKHVVEILSFNKLSI